MSFALVIMEGVYLCSKSKTDKRLDITQRTVNLESGDCTFVNFKVAQPIRSYNDGEISTRYNYWRVEATAAAADKVLSMNLKPGSRVDILCATPDMSKFTIDDTNYVQPVLKIKNASDIRYSDTMYKESEKINNDGEEKEKVQVENVNIEDSPLFSDFAKQLAKEPQLSEPKHSPANNMKEKNDVTNGFKNISPGETPVFPCDFKPFFS